MGSSVYASSARTMEAIAVMVAALAGCAACGDGAGDPPTPAGVGGATTVKSSGAGASTSSVVTTTTTTTSGGGDDRDWEVLAWQGLPCALQVAGPTEEPTLSWKACAVPGCQFIDPAAFYSGSKAVSTTAIDGGIATALVRRTEDVLDSVVWDLATGRERFAIRGHITNCMPNRFIPFTYEGADRGWFGVRDGDSTSVMVAFYEVTFEGITANKLNIPGAWSAQRLAGDADHLALETSLGPNVGIWSRATGTFHTLLDQVSFVPRVGPGGVLFQGPNATNELDGLWWKDGNLSTAIASAAGVHVENPWIVGDQIVWVEGPLGEPGIVKRATFDATALPVTGQAVTNVERTGRGAASERFYVIFDKGGHKLHVVSLETETVTIMPLPEEVKWPSRVDFVGTDPFGTKEVAWVQANDTVYRIELE